MILMKGDMLKVSNLLSRTGSFILLAFISYNELFDSDFLNLHEQVCVSLEMLTFITTINW